MLLENCSNGKNNISQKNKSYNEIWLNKYECSVST